MNIDIILSNQLTARRAELPSIPLASLRRLPQYYYYLVDIEAKGIHQVSCSAIGRDLNCIPVQVRKDLSYTGIIGKPKTGYSVPKLIQTIETFLGWNNINEAFLVGVGNLGTALLGHERFSKFGLRIVAAFDTDPKKIGQWIHEKAVLPIEELSDLAPRMSIHLGIITTPAEVAQSVADVMVKAGIQAIWNFAPVRLRVPEHVFVHKEDLYSSLASLSWKLSRRFRVPVQEEETVANNIAAGAIDHAGQPESTNAVLDDSTSSDCVDPNSAVDSTQRS